jgi:hypothetical protein
LDLPSASNGVKYTDKEKPLVMPATEQSIKVISRDHKQYSRGQFRRQAYLRNYGQNQIAEGVVNGLMKEIAFK